MTLLAVRDLSVAIGKARPVDGVSFDIPAGETFALLGESGCGKSMTALGLMRLLPAAAQIAGGSVRFAGQELCALSEAQMRGVRGGKIGMIFQEPATSLNPVLTVGAQIAEALSLHAGAASAARVVELLAAVGIPDPQRRAGEFPFQMSGGMKQRAMIAMALAGEPELLIADEPTTALDVTIQAQILRLLKEMKKEMGTSILLITHDLGVVAEMCNRVAVMYAGSIVEQAEAIEIFEQPKHPYTQGLWGAIPLIDQEKESLAVIPGAVPDLGRLPQGCKFHPRCPHRFKPCDGERPPMVEVSPGHHAACYLYGGGLGHD